MNADCWNCKHIKSACGEYYCIGDVCPHCAQPMYGGDCDLFECDKDDIDG